MDMSDPSFYPISHIFSILEPDMDTDTNTDIHIDTKMNVHFECVGLVHICGCEF